MVVSPRPLQGWNLDLVRWDQRWGGMENVSHAPAPGNPQIVSPSGTVFPQDSGATLTLCLIAVFPLAFAAVEFRKWNI